MNRLIVFLFFLIFVHHPWRTEARKKILHILCFDFDPWLTLLYESLMDRAINTWSLIKSVLTRVSREMPSSVHYNL